MTKGFLFYIFVGAHVNQVNKKNQTPLYTAVDLRGNLEVSVV